MFFDIRINVRITKEVADKIKLLRKSSPEKYEDHSHVVRIAIIKLYNTELKKLSNMRCKGKKAK